MRKQLIASLVVACTFLFLAHWSYAAPTTVNLDFNGSGSTLAATGFDGAYMLNPAGFTVGGGRLTMTTLPGDSFGQYETDPDSAQNWFFSNIEALSATTLEAHVRVTNVNQNFHGGGIWMGTDEDHYIRLGIFNNSFIGGVSVEALRENEDRWTGAVPPGPGDDIVSQTIGGIQASPQTTPIDAVLRLVRTGSTVQAFASIDNGVTFQQVGGPGYTFVGFATPGNPQGNGSNTIESPVSFKVGTYAVGDGTSPASFAFDSLTATSTPEPASLGAMALLGLVALRRRAR
jgi:hypothetical protein